MSLLLGIDLGTSYFKVGLFDDAGELRGLGRVAVPKTVPAPGRCELAVADFWRTLRVALGEALAQAGAQAREIGALSYSSQASTFLLLDARAEPLTPLIVWIDARGEPESAELQAWAHSDAFRRTIGYTGISGQTAPTKWGWLQHNAGVVAGGARRFMTVSDYFTYALTGERVGDASTAAFLAAYDPEAGGWWPEALQRFQLRPEMMSEVRRPGAPVGRTIGRAADYLGLPAGIPFAVGALDHHAAALGSGLERLADLSISTGTVLAALALAERMTPEAGCYHGRHTDGRRYWRLAFDPNGAGQLEDFQRERAPGCTIEELLAEAGAAARGACFRTEAATRGAAVRAILERVALCHRELVRTVARGGTAPRRIVATGGGARSALWLQIEADVMGVPMVTSACAERACLGAAAFAAVAAGRYGSIAEATGSMVRAGQGFEPDPAAVAFFRDRAE